MNDQEAFDTVCKHLFAQGQQAMDSDGRCMYRAPGGLKCAVGCLIPDDEYWAGFEGSGFGSVAPRIRALTDVSKIMLCCLQNTHDDDDSWKSTESMKQRLRVTAIAYDLDTSVLDNLKFKDR